MATNKENTNIVTNINKKHSHTISHKLYAQKQPQYHSVEKDTFCLKTQANMRIGR